MSGLQEPYLKTYAWKQYPLGEEMKTNSWDDQGEERSVCPFSYQHLPILIKYAEIIIKWNYLCIKHRVTHTTVYWQWGNSDHLMESLYTFMQKPFMTDYNAGEAEFKSKVFLMICPNLSQKKMYICTAVCHNIFLCSSSNGKIFHTYDFSLISATRFNYFKSYPCLEQLWNNPFLHLAVERGYCRARWELQKHSTLSPWFVILLQDPVQERNQSRTENESGILYYIGS